MDAQGQSFNYHRAPATALRFSCLEQIRFTPGYLRRPRNCVGTRLG
jgi:hypothetical protein